MAVAVPVTALGGNNLVKKGTVYFRSLHSNGLVSSAEVQPDDWPEVMQICMDNREADIGRFVRRHLAGPDVATIIEALQPTQSAAAVGPTLSERAGTWLDEGATRRKYAVSRWSGQAHDPDITSSDVDTFLRAGAWEVGLATNPPVTGKVADEAFYRLNLCSFHWQPRPRRLRHLYAKQPVGYLRGLTVLKCHRRS